MQIKNILVLTQNFENYKWAYYHKDLLSTLRKMFNIECYGPGYKKYNKKDDILDILRKIRFKPDLIIVSNTWEVQNFENKEFDIHPCLDLYKTDIPKLMFLNKEYQKLNLKLNYIKKGKIDFVTSVLKNKCKEWEKITGAKFIWEPFGIDRDRFIYQSNIKEKYDFGFTGNLHIKWTKERVRIKKHIFKKNYLKFKWWHNFVHLNRYKEKYSELKIYWGEWQNKNIFFQRRAPFGKDYIKLLNQCKMFLNTKSALGIFNTRFWELMATKTLIICPKDNYNGLLKNKENCVMYETLDEFDKLLFYYSKNEKERKKIEDNAFEFVKDYAWKNILIDLFKKINILK